ncbi:MAG: DNA-binding response regulator [Bacteroidia bacterium]|nr:DNA-binding response regulator [Bacteroidia bacterium]
MPATFWIRHKQSILYGVSLALLLFLLRFMELRFLIFNYSLEIYIGFIALMFTGLGIWLALKLSKPKVEQVIVEKEVQVPQKDFKLNEAELEKLGLSPREMEVLELMAEGLSNQEIAERLFLSLNTIKTHSTNLYVKLNVKRRTQAVEKAKRLSLIE